LLQNRAQSSFGKIAWMVWHRRKSARCFIFPNLMTARAVPPKCESEVFKRRITSR
jgi:hypothetical protein